MKIKYQIIFVIAILLLGILFITYISNRDLKFQKQLTKLDYENSFEIDVVDAYNEHGIYILNNKYVLNSATEIIENNDFPIEDPAIWRPPGFRFIPTIFDISAPFQISKKRYSDTISLEKEDKTIIVILKK